MPVIETLNVFKEMKACVSNLSHIYSGNVGCTNTSPGTKWSLYVRMVHLATFT